MTHIYFKHNIKTEYGIIQLEPHSPLYNDPFVKSLLLPFPNPPKKCTCITCLKLTKSDGWGDLILNTKTYKWYKKIKKLFIKNKKRKERIKLKENLSLEENFYFKNYL